MNINALRFSAISLDVKAGPPLKLASRPQPGGNGSAWEQKSVVSFDSGDTLALTRQAPNAKTDVRFFQGKGGFCAIVSTNDLNFIALPGSRIELPDTVLTMPGAEIQGTQSVATVPGEPVAQTVTDQAMILGAGLATRFEPVSGETTGFPKPGVPLAGDESVIVHIAKHGFKKVIVNTFYMPETIKRQLTEQVPELQFVFIDENKPSGTAGGLVKALQRGVVDSSRPILIMQGDAVTDADLSQLLNAHRQNRAKVTIGVQPVSDAELDKVAILKTDRSGQDGESGKILAYIEKPGRDPKTLKQVGNSRLGSIGFYVLGPEVYSTFTRQGLKRFRRNRIFDYAMDFFPALLKRRKAVRPLMWAEKLGGYWNDIGNPRQYLAVVKDIYASKVNMPLPPNIGEYFENGVIFWPGTRAKALAANVQVEGNVIVTNKPVKA